MSEYKEIEAAFDYCYGDTRRGWNNDEFETFCDGYRAGAADRDRLQAALEEYGVHNVTCPHEHDPQSPVGPCTCGLDAAIAPAAQS